MCSFSQVKRGRILSSGGGGSIINVGSISARIGVRGQGAVAHSAAKDAVISMTWQLAVEGAEHGIRVNTISPGFIHTAQTDALVSDPQFMAMASQGFLVPRPGRPEEIAACAVYLASDESGYTTGSDFVADGGYTTI